MADHSDRNDLPAPAPSPDPDPGPAAPAAEPASGPNGGDASPAHDPASKAARRARGWVRSHAPTLRRHSSSWPPPKPRRLTHFRIILFAVELTALAGVLEFFVLPRFRTRDSEAASPATPPRPALVGTPATPLGDAARPLTGLREVVPAGLPPVADLADGSRLALETQCAYSRDTGLPIELENGVGMRFRLVPPGTFLMGSPVTEKSRWDGEVQHVARVDYPFYMGAHEVTQEQWTAVMGKNPSHFRGTGLPVEEVSWYDCIEFTLALCARDGVDRGVYRLPTEVEWEYACRAGTSTAYFFGNDPAELDRYDHYVDNTYKGPSPVGQKLPNAYGLFNMHGNIWEWCLVRFQAYPGAPTIDEEYQDWRVLRGGNFYEPAENCRSAHRCRLPTASKGNILGLRVVRALPEMRPAAPPPQGKEPAPGMQEPTDAPSPTDAEAPPESDTAPDPVGPAE
jgi:formylglycine-generating enzyme required for sulfatase activity